MNEDELVGSDNNVFLTHFNDGGRADKGGVNIEPEEEVFASMAGSIFVHKVMRNPHNFSLRKRYQRLMEIGLDGSDDRRERAVG
jgi:hypothetical protein